MNPYHVLVRRKNENAKHFIKMSLQLYQVSFIYYMNPKLPLHIVVETDAKKNITGPEITFY